jgi:O-antigen/teichoic acid export membrane protein
VQRRKYDEGIEDRLVQRTAQSQEQPANPAPNSRWIAGVRGLVRSYLTDAGRQALGNLVWLSVGMVLAQGCAFGVLVILTRALGPAEYGSVVVALTLQTYLVQIGSLTSGPVVIREGTQRPEDLDRLTSAYLLLTAVGSGLVCALSLVTIWLVPRSDGERWLLTLVTLGTIPSSLSLYPLFSVHHRQARGAMVTFVGELRAAVALVLFSGGPQDNVSILLASHVCNPCIPSPSEFRGLLHSPA